MNLIFSEPFLAKSKIVRLRGEENFFTLEVYLIKINVYARNREGEHTKQITHTKQNK